jgi:hypothetical protein
VEVYLPAFLTLALCEVNGQLHSLGALPPWKESPVCTQLMLKTLKIHINIQVTSFNLSRERISIANVNFVFIFFYSLQSDNG